MVIEFTEGQLGIDCGAPDLDTNLMHFFRKSREIAEKFPETLDAINFDLDKAALEEKAIRLANRQQELEKADKNGELLLPLADCEADKHGDPLALQTGRPRIEAGLLLFFSIIRGYWGSVSDAWASEWMVDSMSIRAVLNFFKVSSPGKNTVRENLNKMSPDTLRLILHCQAMLICGNYLDDFNECYIDSTHSEANTAFPTDIGILMKLLRRGEKGIRKLAEFGLEVKMPSWIATRIAKMDKHETHISMNVGKTGLKGKTREEMRLFLSLAPRQISDLEAVRDGITTDWESLDLSIEKRFAINILWDKIEQDLNHAAYVTHYAAIHFNTGKPVPANEKILSVADPDAAYIAKGQRNPVIGYKPNIARSKNGFISGVVLPRGNASDSKMLPHVVREVQYITGTTPLLASVDDGYSSTEGVEEIKMLGVVDVVINGAKGRKITDDDLWNSPRYTTAKNQRSAAESGMFTMKYVHNLDRMRRRGIDAVHCEILEKVIAYNFLHMKRLEDRKKGLEDDIGLPDKVAA